MSFRDTILQNVLNNQPSARELPAFRSFIPGSQSTSKGSLLRH
jgi:hypothetical protein